MKLQGALIIACLVFTIVSPQSLHGKARTQSQASSPSLSATSPGVVPGVIVLKLKRSSSISSGVLLGGGASSGKLLKAAGVLSLEPLFRSARQVSEAEAAAGTIDLSRIYLARLASGINPVDAARSLGKSGAFDYAEPKYLNYLRDVPNDTDFAADQSVYFSRMNAVSGWTVAKGDTNVVIADVDGGTYWVHPDLMPNLWINRAEDANHDGRFEHGSPPSGDENGVDDDNNGFVDDVIGWNFGNNSNDPVGLPGTPESAAHGTATASHFGAATNNGIGMAGSSWNCRLMPINAASPGSDNSIAYGYEGIQYAISNGARVINCSWGRSGGASKFEQDVINAAAQAGALVVAAAGNDAIDADLTPQYPANYKNVLAVGATNAVNDGIASFSDYGVNVSVYAPGVSIWSALTNGSYGNGGSGTSYSSPLVAGLAGLIASLHPAWSPEQIAAQIRVTADSVDDDIRNTALSGNVGRGRVNFGRALQESHAGIDVLRSSFLTPSGRSLFLPGDTVALRVTVRNVLFKDATGLSFSAAPSDPVLQTLQGAASGLSLAPGDSLSLPPFLFRVGSIPSGEQLTVKLAWTSNGNERDASAFPLRVFPSIPSWELEDSPTFIALASLAVVDRRVVWTSGGDGSGTSPVVLKTVDGGTTWRDVTANLAGADLYCIAALDSSRAWAGSSDGRIFATADGGQSWSAQPYPAPQSPFIDAIKMFSDLTGYALGDPASGNQFTVLKTTDGGTTWNHSAGEPVGVSGEAGWNNAMWWTDQLHGWFGTNNNRIWRTTDGGGTWTPGSTLLTNSVAVAFSDNLHGLAGYNEPSGGYATITTDGGATWSLVNIPTTQILTSVAVAPGTSLAWLTDGATPFISRDRGSQWTAESFYPFQGAIQHLAFADSSTGWSVTTFGEILRYATDTAIVNPPPPPGTPSSFALMQNYPNPFNPTTTIPFNLPVDSRVTIRVYDVLGRSVRLVADANYLAGTHAADVKFDAGGLASGIYFYRMTADPLQQGSFGSFRAVGKMVVLH